MELTIREKLQKHPLFGIGMVGLTCGLVYGINEIRKYPDMKLSLKIIHLRMGAQGALFGTLAAGTLYSLYGNLSKYIWNRKER